MTAVKQEIDQAIAGHCEARELYKDARYRVAMGELWGVYTPDEVDRLELALANVYEALHDQAGELSRLSALVEFGE